jgi:hypothetical protein
MYRKGQLTLAAAAAKPCNGFGVRPRRGALPVFVMPHVLTAKGDHIFALPFE